MSEVLLGVIVGGVIASITPIISLINENRRWKRDRKLEHLKEERARITVMYSESLKKITAIKNKDGYPVDLVTNMLVLMPDEIKGDFWKFIDKRKESSDDATAEIIHKLTQGMKKSLSEIDKQINDLMK